MPVLDPLNGGCLIFSFADLGPEVILKVENRTSDLQRAYVWLRDAYLELVTNTDLRSEFDEFEFTGPLFDLIVGQQTYPWTDIVPACKAYALDIMCWTDPTTNTNRIRLDETSYQDADAVSQFPGQPVKWYRFNDDIGFVPVPNQTYQIQARAYIMPPIVDNDLAQTQIDIDRSWNEIIVMMAAERGFIELLEYDKAVKVHNLLYGDPRYPDRPGFFNGRKKRREKEAWRKQVSLRVAYRPYGYGRR